MASLTLSELMQGDEPLRILNRRIPSIERPVSTVRLAISVAVQPQDELKSANVLWLLPVFAEALQVEFDSWVLHLAKSQSAGLVIPDTHLP